MVGVIIECKGFGVIFVEVVYSWMISCVYIM